jgi:hypothetical protein
MVSYKRADKFFAYICKEEMDCKTRNNQDGVKGYKNKITKKNPKEIEINLLGIVGDLLCIRHSRYGLFYVCIPEEEWLDSNI